VGLRFNSLVYRGSSGKYVGMHLLSTNYSNTVLLRVWQPWWSIIKTKPGQEINWEREAEIPSSFAETETIRTIPGSATTPPRTIIITGDTRFLVRQLLRCMVHSPDIKEIHCLAVRERDELPPLFNSDKVHIVTVTSQGPTLASLKHHEQPVQVR
jgi:hypothetical protein